jgi:glycosyltransferase involved in cell wall biosynthesis
LYFDTYKSKPFQYIKLYLKLFFLFLKIKPDVVQTNLFDDSLPALLAARMAGVKKRVITKQDTGYHVNYTPSIIKYDKFNNWNATDIIAVSEESKEFIIKNENGKQNKITLIHHGVDELFITSATQQQVDHIKTKFNLAGKTVLGTVARYIELKGYIDLIDAVELLKTKHSDFIFLGVGGGPQKEELEKKIKQKNLESYFILTDPIDYDLIPAIYACLDIYVHAAKFEAFGFVIAEAMFNKNRIVSTRVGASRDVLIHKESAYLTNFNSPHDIFEGIDYMMKETTNKIGEKAYQIAKESFSREKMWENYKKVFLT